MGRQLGDLTATTTLDDTDLVYVERAAGSRKMTIASLREALRESAYGQLGMVGNATATVCTLQSTFYKVAGTTTANAEAQGFTHTDNRLTYTGGSSALFLVQGVATISNGNHEVFAARIAKNGTTLSITEGRAETGSGGADASLAFQGIVELATNDYIEAWIANATAAGTSPVVTTLNIVVTRL